MAKQLVFTFRGETYRVDEQGRINANNIGHFSDTWLFLGGMSHHWRNSIDVPLREDFVHPTKLNGCLGVDKDHGTVRGWGGAYNGKLPRITHAHVVNI